MTATGTRSRLDSLTGLRFFAALFVFVSHANMLFAETSIADTVERLVHPGAAGVSFFFILSGFVLAWAYRDGDRALPFYRRRFARIAPAYWVAVAIFIPLTLGNHLDEWATKLAQIAPSFLAVQAWIPDKDYYWAGNGVAWSLSCEVFFYALFPALIVLAARTPPRRQITALGVLALLVVVVPLLLRPEDRGESVGFWVIYIFPVQRLWEFCIGILICLWIKRGSRVPVSMRTAVAMLGVAYVVSTFAPVYLNAVALFFIPFALIIAAAAQADLAGAPSPLRSRWLVRLGEWSFAFYLIHQIVIKVAARFAPQTSVVGAAALTVACLAASVVCAYLLYAIVERPLERRLRGGTLPVSAGGLGHAAPPAAEESRADRAPAP